MILYAMPFTCSLAVRLTLTEQGRPHTVRWARRFTHELEDGGSFAEINPKRRVPALLLEDGELLTELPTVLVFLDGDARPARERRRFAEWASYLGTELHRPVLAPLFDPATPAETQSDIAARLLPPVLDHLDGALGERDTLLGDARPSGVDAYLLWALLLARHRLGASRRPALDRFTARWARDPVFTPVLADERRRLG